MSSSLLRRLFHHAPRVAVGAVENPATQSEAEGQFQRGLELERGSAATPDFTAAVQCFRQAAERGHTQAQLNLGLLLARGQGAPRDENQAIMWLRKAAQDGNAAAQFNLGMKLYRAILDAQRAATSEARIEAYMWLRLAATQGFPDSEAARDGLTFAMTRDEVTAGNRRCAAFLDARALPSANLT